MLHRFNRVAGLLKRISGKNEIKLNIDVYLQGK